MCNSLIYTTYNRPLIAKSSMVCSGRELQHAKQAPLNVYATSRAPKQLFRGAWRSRSENHMENKVKAVAGLHLKAANYDFGLNINKTYV